MPAAYANPYQVDYDSESSTSVYSSSSSHRTTLNDTRLPSLSSIGNNRKRLHDCFNSNHHFSSHTCHNSKKMDDGKSKLNCPSCKDKEKSRSFSSISLKHHKTNLKTLIPSSDRRSYHRNPHSMKNYEFNRSNFNDPNRRLISTSRIKLNKIQSCRIADDDDDVVDRTRYRSNSNQSGDEHLKRNRDQ